MADELIPLEIRATPAAIRATLEETRPAARRAAEAMRARAPRRVYIIGNGSSFYSSLAASYTARALAGPDDPLVLAWLAGDFRYYTPALGERDVVIGVSASGEFRDVLAMFERLEGTCLRVGITHVPGSSITRLADHTLISAGGASRVPVMTKTYASTLTAAHLLMLELFAASDDWYDGLAMAADRASDALQAMEPLVPGLVFQLSRFQHAFYFGAGPAYATSLEGALKMKEMALVHAEGSETWEMASGPATMVDSETLCVALYTGGPSDEATADGARHAHLWKARVLEVGPESVAGDLHLRVPAAAKEPFASLSLVPPLALLAYRIARARGLNPDRPEWSERYRSQGMTHIVGDDE